MTDDLYEALRASYELQEEFGFCQAEIDGMSGFVFMNRFGSIHNPGGVNDAIERIRTNYNTKEILAAAKEGREPVVIPHFSCHQIRHTFATRLCEVEGNLKVIQTIMGHADIRTTMDIYAEATAEGMELAMGKLSQKKRI